MGDDCKAAMLEAGVPYPCAPDCPCALEIENKALRAENERLREALRKIAGGGVPAQSAFWQWHDRYQDQRGFARAALETKKGPGD